ncbi:Uncharacterised protein [Vibrio cholerae]|nr:Uncharacterised protein [Vibrio cholerae]
MIRALYRDEYVAFEIFIRHIPWLFAALFHTTNVQTFTLSESVVHQALVLTNHFAFRGFNFTRLGWQIAR